MLLRHLCVKEASYRTNGASLPFAVLPPVFKIFLSFSLYKIKLIHSYPSYPSSVTLAVAYGRSVICFGKLQI